MRKRDFSSPKDAESYCYWLLSQRDYAEGQLLRKLRDKGYLPEAAEEAVTALKAKGYVDDGEYARQRVRFLVNGKKGAAYIKSDLFSKGIDEKIIGEALEECYNPEGLPELLRSKLDSVKKSGPVTYKDIQKIKGFLFRRGFSPDEINEAVKRADYE